MQARALYDLAIGLYEVIKNLPTTIQYPLSVTEMLYDFALSKFTNLHVPENSERERIKANRKKFWHLLSEDSGNPLINHLRAFSYYDEVENEIFMSDESIFVALTEDFKMNEEHGRLITAASISLPKLHNFHDVYFSFLKGIHGKISPNRAAELMHPHDSGLYIKDSGLFNAERYKAFQKYAVNDADGTLVISKEKFHECLKYLKNEDKKNYHAPWKKAGLSEQAIGALGSAGEFEFFFDLLPSRWIGDTAFAKMSDIETFYRNTTRVMEEISAGRMHLPPKPTAENPTSTTIISESLAKPEVPQRDKFDKFLGWACDQAKGMTDTCPSFFNMQHLNQPHIGNTGFFAMNNTCPASSGNIAPPAPPLMQGR